VLSLNAQVAGYGDKQAGQVPDTMPTILQHVNISQNIGQTIPLDGIFRDSTGNNVRMRDYFGKRPVILTLVYYNCQILCSEELTGLASALQMVNFTPGKDFDIVILSIDPSETPALAAEQKARYVQRYGRPETANGWHFLTGDQPDINRLAKAVGFGYVRVPGPDGRLTQFAHASAIEIATPEGKLAQYYMGVVYSSNDLRLGLVEASNHKVGSPVDNILTYCYHYDPSTGKHSLVIARVIQLGGFVTLVALGGFMAVMFRRDVKNAAHDDKKANG
jgi:protein SCO1/2